MNYHNKEQIYLVKYIDMQSRNDEDIEGYIKTKEEFKEWLNTHNLQRKKDGHLIESEYEFKLIAVDYLKKD